MFSSYLIWAKVGFIALALVVAFGAGWRTHTWKYEAAEKKAVEEHLALLNDQFRAAVKLEAKRITDQQERIPVVQTIIKEVVRRVKVQSDYCGLRAADSKLFDGIRTNLGLPPVSIPIGTGDSPSSIGS